MGAVARCRGLLSAGTRFQCCCTHCPSELRRVITAHGSNRTCACTALPRLIFGIAAAPPHDCRSTRRGTTLRGRWRRQRAVCGRLQLREKRREHLLLLLLRQQRCKLSNLRHSRL